MTAEGERRSPSLVAIAAFAIIVPLLAVPMLFSGRTGAPALQGSDLRAETSNSFTITEPLTLSTTPGLVLEAGTLSLVSSQAGRARSGEALFTVLSRGGADLVLDGAKLRVRQRLDAADSVGTLPGADALAPLAAAVADLKFNTLTIKDAAITFDAPGGGEETLTDVNAEVNNARKTSAQANGSFRLRGEEHTFAVAAALPHYKKDGTVPVRASVKGPLVELKFDGRYAAVDRSQLLANNAELRLADVRGAARWLGANWPQGPGLGEFTAKGLLTWSDDTLSFEDARFTLDGNASTGGLSLKFRPERPLLEGTLAFDSLNIGHYFPEREAERGRLANMEGLPSLIASLVRFPGGASPSLIREIDADLRISAVSVSLGGPALGRCAATVSISHGKLFADLAEVEFELGGSGEAQVTVDMSREKPRYALRGKFADLDMARATETHLGQALLEGTGTLDIEVAGRGETEDAVLSSLDGRIELQMPQGARLGVGIEALAQAAQASPLAGGWGDAATQATRLDTLSARFLASDGVLTTETLRGATGDKVITGSGHVNVAERTLDLIVRVAGAPAADGAGSAPEPAPPSSFRIIGRWEAPSIRPASPADKAEDQSSTPRPIPISLPGPLGRD
jgi:AsmA protein